MTTLAIIGGTGLGQLANSDKTPTTCHFESKDWLFTGHRFL